MKRLFLTWIGAGLLEAPFTMLLFLPHLAFLERHLFWSLAAHGVAFVLLFKTSPRKSWLFLLPFFGWFFALLPLLSDRSKEVQLFPEDESWPLPGQPESGQPITPEKLSPNVERKERVLQELDFLSLADILGGTDALLKRGAIERLAQLKTPEAIKVLLTHRTDPSMEIRFYATSALARIKKEFDEELESAKQEMKKDIYKVSARFLLAKRYLSYARSHLLDPETEASYEREALLHLQFVTGSPYGSEEANWLLLEIYRNREAWDQAFAILGQGSLNQAGRFEESKAIMYYSMGQFDQLASQLATMKAAGSLAKEWVPIAHWWGVA